MNRLRVMFPRTHRPSRTVRSLAAKCGLKSRPQHGLLSVCALVRLPLPAENTMFRPVPSSVQFPALEAQIGAFWKERRVYEKSLARAPEPRGSSFMKDRPRQTACPIPATASPGQSRTCFPAIAPCAATCASAKPVGIPTDCRSKWKCARNWGSIPRRKSRPSASSRSFTSAWRASFATPSNGNVSPSGWAFGSTWTRPTSRTTSRTWRAFGGR